MLLYLLALHAPHTSSRNDESIRNREEQSEAELSIVGADRLLKD